MKCCNAAVVVAAVAAAAAVVGDAAEVESTCIGSGTDSPSSWTSEWHGCLGYHMDSQVHPLLVDSPWSFDPCDAEIPLDL